MEELEKRKELFLTQLIQIVSFFLLLLPLAISPFLYFPTNTIKGIWIVLFSETLFFLWILLISINPTYKPKITPVFIGATIYLILLFFSMLSGVNPSQSFWSNFGRFTGVSLIFHYFLIFLVWTSVFPSEFYENLFFFSSIIAVIVGILSVFTVNYELTRGGGPIGNESFLGTYLLFNFFFALYLFFNSKETLKKVFLLIILILLFSILLAGIDLTKLKGTQLVFAILFKEGVRAVKISLYLGIILFFCFYLFFSKRKILRILGFISLISYFLFGFILTILFLFKPTGFVFTHLIKKIGPLGGRPIVWESVLRGAGEKFYFGWGPENFEYFLFKYFDPRLFLEESAKETWFDRAHNVVFDHLICNGIFGLIAYFSIFFTLFFTLWKKFFKKEIDFKTPALFTSLFVAYFIQNLTVFDTLTSYLMFFLVLSFVNSLNGNFSSPPQKTIYSQPSLKIALISLFFILISIFEFAISPFLSAIFITRGAFSEIGSRERIMDFKIAFNISPLARPRVVQFLAMDFCEGKEKKEKPNLNFFAEGEFFIEELKKNVKENPLDFISLFYLGKTYNTLAPFDTQSVKKGEEVFKQLIVKFPNDLRGYWGLIDNLIIQKRFREAEKIAKIAISIEPRVKESHEYLIKVYYKSGEKEKLQKAIEEAVRINPKWKESLEKTKYN